MPRPVVHAHTERLYDRLPELYRDADLDQLLDGSGYPLLRFLSLIGDQAGDVEDTLDLVDPDRGGALTNPDTIPLEWLPWLAQLVGLGVLPGSLTEAERRNAVSSAAGGRYVGTRQAIADAARPALTNPDAGYVVVRNHHQGNPFVLSVNVAPEVAPADLNTVLDAIEAVGARPAGFDLVIDTYAATWDQVEARGTGGTWADVETSWATLEATGAV